MSSHVTVIAGPRGRPIWSFRHIGEISYEILYRGSPYVYVKAYTTAFVAMRHATIMATKDEPPFDRIDLVDGWWVRTRGRSSETVGSDFSEVLNQIVKHYKINLLKTITE